MFDVGISAARNHILTPGNEFLGILPTYTLFYPVKRIVSRTGNIVSPQGTTALLSNRWKAHLRLVPHPQDIDSLNNAFYEIKPGCVVRGRCDDALLGMQSVFSVQYYNDLLNECQVRLCRSQEKDDVGAILMKHLISGSW